MIPIFKSLDQISTGYTVFEQDQVLTHDQLNSLADYADDQIRLTRTKLIGVGLGAGLRLSLNSNVVTASKGMGVTTDGDLLYLSANTQYTQFRLYDASYPAYPPFYVGEDVNGTMHPVYELLTADVVDVNAKPLSDFLSVTGSQLSQMVGILLMESYLKDDDICSGTDCDNLGKEAKNRIKLVVVGTTVADALAADLTAIPTANSSFASLGLIVADRPVITSTADTPAKIAAIYRTSCLSMHNSLTTALPGLYPACAAFLGDVFASNPGAGWVSRLGTIKDLFDLSINPTTADKNIQYYYDFLKDVVETYNDFRDLLFGDTTWNSPDPGTFPKHLMLGRVVPGTDPSLYRMGFYPSPIVSDTIDEVERARFLAKKIDMLINAFSLSGISSIKVTPSSFEDVPLEKRAIPCYYPATTANQYHAYWNFALTRRRMERHNYSYHASSYAAQGGAANPFRSQMGRFSFFRIEGHIGKQAMDVGATPGVVTTLKTMIKNNNLPFAVHAVHAGTSRTNIKVKPDIRYTDLHRLHYMMRQDLVLQLDDVTTFGDAFKFKIDNEPSTENEEPEECDCPTPRVYAGTANTDLTARATTTQSLLNVSYTDYVPGSSWHSSMQDTLVTGGQYKSNLGAVAKTSFVTPVDTLISSPSVTWLPFVDTLIQSRDEAEDDKLLFHNFIAQNPSIEHFGGVTRGGTFVLVYDESGYVVTDFMLPYYWVDTTETTVDEPALTRPNIKTTFVVEDGVTVFPSRTTFVDNKINSYGVVAAAAVDAKLAVQDAKISFQEDYVGLFQSSINILSGAAPAGYQMAAVSAANRTADATEVIAASSGVASFKDEFLTAAVSENNFEMQKITTLRKKAANEQNTELRNWYNQGGLDAERDLAASGILFIQHLESLVRHVAGFSVAPGTEPNTAAGSISLNLKTLTDTETKDRVKAEMNRVIGATTNADLRTICNNIIANLG